MSRLATAYPCSLCGTQMFDTDEGRRITLGKRSIVVCRALCEPRVRQAAEATKTVVAHGVQALIQQRAPGLLPVLREAYAAWQNAKHGNANQGAPS